MMLGRQHIAKPKPTSIADLLTRLHPSMRRVLADDVQLLVNGAEEDVIALVDEAEIERALLNLVLNAGDAMPRGGTLTIEWRRQYVAGTSGRVADGTYVSISVSDTGDGMDRETLDRIFDPFFTTKSDKGGTGLGLATVYAFTKESHGAVDATSTPGDGTTITMLLPEAVGVRPASPATVDTPATFVARAVGERVLVVED